MCHNTHNRASRGVVVVMGCEIVKVLMALLGALVALRECGSRDSTASVESRTILWLSPPMRWAIHRQV